jgi:hypothetical protein
MDAHQMNNTSNLTTEEMIIELSQHKWETYEDLEDEKDCKDYDDYLSSMSVEDVIAEYNETFN